MEPAGGDGLDAAGRALALTLQSFVDDANDLWCSMLAKGNLEVVLTPAVTVRSCMASWLPTRRSSCATGCVEHNAATVHSAHANHLQVGRSCHAEACCRAGRVWGMPGQAWAEWAESCSKSAQAFVFEAVPAA